MLGTSSGAYLSIVSKVVACVREWGRCDAARSTVPVCKAQLRPRLAGSGTVSHH